MLKLFRKKIVMKTILWGLVIIIVPAFVMWGGASMSRSKEKGPNYVGIVNNRKVSFEEFSAALTGVRSQIILNYFNQPKLLEALLSNKPMLAKLAWDRILMMEEVKKAGIKISDKEVIEALRGHPLFLRNGVFDDRFYAYMLRNNIGLEPRAFEEIVRGNISLQKLSTSLTKDIKLSDEEILAEYNKDPKKSKSTDAETIAKEKAESAKVILEAKSNAIMEKWLKGLEDKAKLAIKLEDTEKYYQ